MFACESTIIELFSLDRSLHVATLLATYDRDLVQSLQSLKYDMHWT